LIAELENLLRHMILEGDDKSVEFTEIMDCKSQRMDCCMYHSSQYPTQLQR